MRDQCNIGIILLLMLLDIFAVNFVYAHDTPEALAHALVNAVNESSVEKVKALIHPDCPTSLIKWENLERNVKRTIPSGYEIIVEDLKPDHPIFSYVKPAVPVTKLFQIVVRRDDGAITYPVNDVIAQKNGKWYLVLCGVRVQPGVK